MIQEGSLGVNLTRLRDEATTELEQLHDRCRDSKCRQRVHSAAAQPEGTDDKKPCSNKIAGGLLEVGVIMRK